MSHATMSAITPATIATMSQVFEPDDAPAIPPIAPEIPPIRSRFDFSFMKYENKFDIKMFL